MTELPRQLSDLIAVYEIEKLKARYFRYLDTKQWDLWRDLFADDLVYYMDDDSRVPRSTEPVVTGADTFVGYVSGGGVHTLTVHQGHMPEIEVLDDTNATGVWAMYDWVDDPPHGFGMQGFGHYHEKYRKETDGRWRICELRLTRLRVNRVDSLPTERNPRLAVLDTD